MQIQLSLCSAEGDDWRNVLSDGTTGRAMAQQLSQMIQMVSLGPSQVNLRNLEKRVLRRVNKHNIVDIGLLYWPNLV